MAEFLTALLLAVCVVLSWGVCALMVKLVTFCFGLSFSFIAVTVIWVIGCLVVLVVMGARDN